MDTAFRPSTRAPLRSLLVFAAVFALLYGLALATAERVVARGETETALQKLLAARGQHVDWLVLGASHALPLDYGDVPQRLRDETGQTMLVAAEIGAGPLYNRAVFEQALEDLSIGRMIYVVDAFAFGSREWNEARLSDRGLLRRTPLRLSTARILASTALRHRLDPRGLIDYLSGFSKLNPADRFPQAGWRGAETFDRRFRPSRHAVSARIDYLYPDGAPLAEDLGRYLGMLDDMIARAATAGIEVLVIKPPLPEAFGDSLPEEATFDAALRARLARRGVEFLDLSAAIPGAENYFDTDHLNRAGVDTLYRDYLRPRLAGY